MTPLAEPRDDARPVATSRSEAFADFVEFGFTVEQARALTDGGYALWFIRAESVGL